MKADADEAQEYQCLLLEGHAPAEARRLARSANDKVNRKRLAGPRSGDTRHGHGDVPLISDLTNVDLYDAVTSVTQDTRSDIERVSDWERQDALRGLLEHCTDIQRAVLTDLYGLESGEPMTYAQVARKHGFATEGWTRKHRTRAINRIKRAIAVTAADRLEHRRQLKRNQMARYRAKRNISGGL